MTIPDLPDDYPWLPGSERFPLGDIGELAARIGSPVVYDRRGEVLWLDDFEFGVAKWKEENGGNDGSIAANTVRPLIGEKCMLMSSPSSGGEAISAVRYLNPFRLNNWGIELAFAFTTVFNDFRVELDWIDGTNIWHAAIKVDYATATVAYMEGLTTWIDFADLEIVTIADGMFNRLKMVADFENETYLRVLLNQTEYDLSDIDLLKRTSSLGPYSHITLTFNGNINNVRTMKVDSVIITANEP